MSRSICAHANTAVFVSAAVSDEAVMGWSSLKHVYCASYAVSRASVPQWSWEKCCCSLDIAVVLSALGISLGKMFCRESINIAID